MIPESQRIEMANLDGWELRHCKYHGHTSWHSPLGVCAEGSVSEMLPDYLSDLNAVHELEKKLLDNASMDERSLWLDTLGSCITYRETGNYYDNGFEFHYSVARATAAQRCEAILKVKGLWR